MTPVTRVSLRSGAGARAVVVMAAVTLADTAFGSRPGPAPAHELAVPRWNTCQPMPDRPRAVPRVVVVGAGVSGLAAAHRVLAEVARRRGPRAGGLARASAGACAPPRSAGCGSTSVPRRCCNRRPEAVRLSERGRPRRRPGLTRDDRGPPVEPRPAGAVAAHADGRARRPPFARRRDLGEGAGPRRDGRGAAAHGSGRRATSASATWSRSGWARRSSTGWWSRCSAGCTPATPARSPPGPPCPSWWRCWSATGRSPAPPQRSMPPVDGERARPVFAGIRGGVGAPARALARTRGAGGPHRRDRARPRRASRSGLEPGGRLGARARDRAGGRRRPGHPGAADRPAAQRRRPVAALELARIESRVDGDRHARRPGARPPRGRRARASWCRRSTATPSRRRRSPSPSGTGCARPARGRGPAAAPLLAGSAPRGADPPAHATRSWSSWRPPT